MAILNEGFSTQIVFGVISRVNFFEKTVTPIPLSGRGPVDITTMRNTALVTRNPKKLLDTGNMTLTVAYDTEVYDDIAAGLGVIGPISISFPDNSTIVFWGWLDEFKPHEIKEGEQPTAEITIISSNQDEGGNEIEPIYTAP